MSVYTVITIGCLLGALIHTLVKVNGINRRLKTVNYRQVFSEYWSTDWALFLLSIVGIGAVVFISSEWLNLKETDKVPTSVAEVLQYKIVQFTKTVSVLVGYCIDSIINAYLGGTEQKLIQKGKDQGLNMEQIIKVKPPKDENNTTS